MFKFSKRSKARKDSCHTDLQKILDEAIKYLDLSVIQGHRGKSEQNDLESKGMSKVKYPKSKHNSMPSNAVDVMLWNNSEPHIRWEDRIQQAYVAGFLKAIACMKGIDIRQGVDWNGDMLFNESFWDGPHMELKNG